MDLADPAAHIVEKDSAFQTREEHNQGSNPLKMSSDTSQNAQIPASDKKVL
jgi:hypothetical protein